MANALILDFEAGTADIKAWPISTVSYYTQALTLDFFAMTADIIPAFSPNRRAASGVEGRLAASAAENRTTTSEADL